MLQGQTWFLFGLLFSAASCYAEQDQLKDAKACVLIKSKLERLYCFDQAFMTPLATNNTQKIAKIREAEWIRAYTSEGTRQGETHFLFGQQEDKPNNMWLTATAIGAIPPRPILMLSCIDEISRVELIMPKEISDNAVLVGVNKPSDQGQLWMSDNSGLVFRTGRGIPAIQVMKSMLFNTSLSLSSNNEVFNDLQFDATDLPQTIKYLQTSCGW